MKKKALMIFAIFVFIVLFVKGIDVTSKYEMNIFDYIKYSMPLNAEEREYLKENDIVYGIDIKDAPFSYVLKETKQNKGILVDYFNQLSVTLEKEFAGVTYENYDLAKSLIDNEINAAVISKGIHKEEVFLFTEPLFTSHSKILVRNESEFNQLKDVENIKIAVVTGSITHHYANEFFKDNNSVDLILTNDLDECLYLLGLGQVDAIVGNETKIAYELNQAIKDKKFRFINDSIYSEDISVAINKNDEILYSIINKGILELKENNQYLHIHSKWFGSFMPEVRDISDYNYMSNIIILILAIVFVLGSWNHVISTRVEERTKELNESKNELRDVIDSLHDGIIVFNDKGIIQECNNSFIEILGISKKELLDSDFYSLENLKPYISHINEDEPFSHGPNYYLVTQRRLDTLTHMNLFIIRDYTERYKHEFINRQDAKMIAVGELSAGLAHEIRNPLGLIKNYLFVLGNKHEDEFSIHAISVIDNSVKRIHALINNLLNFSKLSRKENRSVDISKTLESILLLEEKNLEDNNVKLELDKPANLPISVLLNEDVLKLSIINLINNSIDAFTDFEIANRKIVLSLSFNDDVLNIKFKDNGKGIEESNIEKIFNPFFTTKDTGTGLGLYILASELRAIGGKIECESEINKGTKFTINIPIKGVSNEK
ncbi:MAG TPA: transporter substrate-binding domain-containing protein [Anaerovoracaceae bacterium]|nr:transporter substrate-binding domain-containing protein [Anaerovoracaceae bacterium]